MITGDWAYRVMEGLRTVRRNLITLIIAGTLLAVAACAEANSLPVFQAVQTGPGATFTYGGVWSGGDGVDHTLSAKVSFKARHGRLKVRLSNTYAGDVNYQIELLNAVFFDIAGSVALTPVSATVPAGSTVLFPEVANASVPHDPLPLDVVGGEFAFRGDLSGAPGDAQYGISSVGLDLFGPGNLFPPQIDLDKPKSPDGSNYGLTSAGDDPTTGKNPDVKGQEPIIQHEVVFTFCGLPRCFNPSQSIYNVWFLYGTSWEQLPPPVEQPPIPEPLTLLGVTAGLAGLGGYLRRRLR